MYIRASADEGTRSAGGLRTQFGLSALAPACTCRVCGGNVSTVARLVQYDTFPLQSITAIAICVHTHARTHIDTHIYIYR